MREREGRAPSGPSSRVRPRRPHRGSRKPRSQDVCHLLQNVSETMTVARRQSALGRSAGRGRRTCLGEQDAREEDPAFAELGAWHAAGDADNGRVGICGTVCE